MSKTQTVPIERVREIARRRLELQSRLIEIRDEWLKHCDRLLGMTDGAGTPVEPDEQQRNEALARLTERHASQVWEAIYLTGPAGEASVGPEAGSARPCSLVREAPLGGPVSVASERGAAGVNVEAPEDGIESALYAEQLALALAERRRIDPGAPDAVVLGVVGLEREDGTLALATERESTSSPDGHPPAELVWRSRKGREPTTRPAPAPERDSLAELDWVVCEAGISPPELVRRVSERVERDVALWDRVIGGDLLNDDQAITLIVVLCQELMASVGHLRPMNVRVSYHLELRELNQKR